MSEVKKLSNLRRELDGEDRKEFDMAYGKIKDLSKKNMSRIKAVISRQKFEVDHSDYIEAAKVINGLSRKVKNCEMKLPENNEIGKYASELAFELVADLG